MSRESALSAIERGDLSVLQHVLEESQWDIGSEPLDSKGQTALHIACANGHLDIAKYLVNEKRCSVTVEDHYGHSPLVLSLINKHWIVADFLLKAAPNSDINEQKVIFLTYNKSLVARIAYEALVESCKNGYFELVKYLIRELDVHISKEDIQSACDNGHWEMLLYLRWKRGDSQFAGFCPHLTPLHDNVKVALKGELWEVTKVLLMLVQQRSSHMSLGLSSKGLKQLIKVVANGNLNSACSHGYLQVVEYYHRVGILNSEQLGGAPLETARSSGHLHIVHHLLKHCRCTVPDDMSEIHVACSLGDVEKVKTALDRYGSAILSTTDRYGTAAIHYAAYEPAVLSMIVYGEVSERGILLSIQDSKGNIPLHHCIMSQCDESVNLLIALHLCDVTHLNLQGKALLHTACEQSNISALQLLVTCGRCDLNIPDSNGDAALHIAVCSESNSVQMVYCLLQNGRCDINLTNRLHSAPLHVACKQGSIEVVEKLVADERCDPYIQDANGDTALYAAVCSEIDKDEKVQCLLGRGKCQLINTDTSYTTELNVIIDSIILSGIKSLHNIKVSIVERKKAILFHGTLTKRTPPNVIVALIHHVANCNSMTSMHLEDPTSLQHKASITAQIYSHKKRLQTKANHNQNLTFKFKGINGSFQYNSQQETLLHAACRGGYCDMTVTLLNNGADVQAVDSYGNAAIHIACENVQFDCFKILLSCGRCDPNQKNTDGDTVLHMVFRINEAVDLDNIHMVQCVLETLVADERCDLNIQDRNGDTALHKGVDNALIVKRLLESGRSKCDIFNREGRTPFHKAVATANMASIECFLKNGADVLQSTNNKLQNAPIHIACKHCRLDVLEILLGCKSCDPNQQNAEGDTALHIVCRMEMTIDITHEYLHLLMCTPGFNPAIVNHEGLTPFEIVDSDGCTLLHNACAEGYSLMVELLVKNGADILRPDRSGDAPIHIVCKHAYSRLLKVLVSCNNCDPNQQNAEGDTALHIVCRMSILQYDNKVQYVQALISTPGINPEIVNHVGLTPIELTGTHYLLIDIIKKFLENKKSSVQAYLKIFVIGNSGTGKSTLIKAVTTEASRWRKYSPFSRAKYVNPDDVAPHTAGIVPIPFNSNDFGNAVLYDFAGQHEYYSSHAAVMENLILPSPPLFLLLIDISKPMEEIKEELVYWWHFINNQSQRAAIPPHVILGGSHKDLVKSRGEDEQGRLEMMIKDCIKDIPVIFQFVDYFPLDCRKLVSRGLSALLTQFKATCQFLRQGVDVNLHCHILKAFLTTPEFQNLIYCEVAKVMERIEYDNAPLPRSYNQLIPLFASLNDQGHILLLQNHTDESKSWVILKPEELLAHVNGSIFAPDYFQEYFDHFAMSTGVVTLSKLKEQFAKYNHEVIVKYLIHFEFCFQIKDQHTLNMITNNEVHMSLTTETTEYQEKYYFFPSLVRVENPTDVCQQQICISFKCGWLYMCSNVTEQLATRFLHVLILRLAFACEHPDDLTAMESVVLLRSCSVWKRGIAWWTNDGIETIVEVGLQCRWVAVMMRCPDTEKVQCTELRSKVIHTVLKARKDFCPAITMKEFLIAPSSLQYPFEGRKLTLYSMREIAKVITEGKKYAKDTGGKNPISIPQLLPFEPYHNMGDLITKFFSGDTSLAVTPEDLTRLAEKCHDKLAKLKEAFKPDISSFQRDCVLKADCTEVEKCVALFHILQRRGFKTWKDFEQEFSRFSIFCGHNPMVRMI